jgi:hypothetical protein
MSLDLKKIFLMKDSLNVEVVMQKYHHIQSLALGVMNDMMDIGKNVINVFKRFTLKNEI